MRYTGDYVTAIDYVDNAKVYADAWAARITAGTHEIYDVGHVPNDSTWDCKDSDDATGDDHPYATDYTTRIDTDNLKLEGRTLYLNKDDALADKDFGLTLASDNTPTVLIQDEGGKTNVISEYPSVKAAISAMEDRNGSAAGFGFKGRITAVLNSQGVAQWAVIKSDTTGPVSSGGNVSPSTRVDDVIFDG